MRLGFLRFIKLFIANLFVQSSWSFFSMQAMGFLSNITVGTEKEKRQQIIKNHKGFFNTHPYMSAYIIGATMRAYDLNENLDEIKRHSTIAQQSFASIGDSLFWQALRPCLLVAGVIIGLKYGIVGPLLFLIVYNAIHLYHRVCGIYDGYRVGWDIIYILKSKRFTIVQMIAESLGAFCVGILPWLLTRNLVSLIFIPLAMLFVVLLAKKIPAVIIIFIVTLVMVITLIARL